MSWSNRPPTTSIRSSALADDPSSSRLIKRSRRCRTFGGVRLRFLTMHAIDQEIGRFSNGCPLLGCRLDAIHCIQPFECLSRQLLRQRRQIFATRYHEHHDFSLSHHARNAQPWVYLDVVEFTPRVKIDLAGAWLAGEGLVRFRGLALLLGPSVNWRNSVSASIGAAQRSLVYSPHRAIKARRSSMYVTRRYAASVLIAHRMPQGGFGHHFTYLF